MLKSMTAFGRAQGEFESKDITVEIRSVNSRYLDCNVKAPRALAPFEERIKAYVQKNLTSRGKVDVSVMLDRKIASNCPAITPSAVMHDSKTAYVYVIDKDNKVTRRDVKLGSERGKYVIVNDGLKVGETIIVDGTHKVRPGVEVEVAK